MDDSIDGEGEVMCVTDIRPQIKHAEVNAVPNYFGKLQKAIVTLNGAMDFC